MQEAPPVNTGPYIPTPGGSLDAGSMIIGLAFVLVIFGIIIVYRVITHYQNKKIRRVSGIHFNIDRFLSYFVRTKLGKYNQLFTIVLIGVIVIMFVPPLAIQVATTDLMFRGFGTFASWFMGGLSLAFYYQDVQNKERDRNSNSIWVDAEIFVPGRLSFGRLLRRLRKVSEVRLTETQVDELITQQKALVDMNKKARQKAIAILKRQEKKALKLEKKGEPSGVGRVSARLVIEESQKAVWDKFTPHKWKLLKKRIMKAYTYRCTIDKDWHVLLIMSQEWKDSMILKPSRVFDETTSVNVQRTRFDMAYMTSTTIQIPYASKDGAPTFTDLSAGVFVITFNDFLAEEAIVQGKYNAPDSLYALFGELKHLFQQNIVSSHSHNSRTSEVTTLREDLDKERVRKDTGGEDQFNVLVRGWKRLFTPIDTKSIMFQGFLIFLLSGFVWFWLFSILGMFAAPEESTAYEGANAIWDYSKSYLKIQAGAIFG